MKWRRGSNPTDCSINMYLLSVNTAGKLVLATGLPLMYHGSQLVTYCEGNRQEPTRDGTRARWRCSGERKRLEVLTASCTCAKEPNCRSYAPGQRVKMMRWICQYFFYIRHTAGCRSKVCVQYTPPLGDEPMTGMKLGMLAKLTPSQLIAY